MDSSLVRCSESEFAVPSEAAILRLLERVGMALEISVQASDVVTPQEVEVEAATDPLAWLTASANHAGIFVKETTFQRIHDAVAFLQEGYPLIIVDREGTFVVVDSVIGREFDATTISEHVVPRPINRRRFTELVMSDATRVFVAKKELECDPLSSSPASDAGHQNHALLTPMRRFMALLNLERRDIWTVVLFAFVSGVLTLATPLAVESLVNVVSWGIYLQPIIVLGLILMTCLGIAGVLRILQTVVVEMIQRRQFVRIVSDLAHRFPRANQNAIIGEYPRELANRVFDIMTIQKATAVLLLDGLSIVLTTVLGLVLLAFYHPFLLGFDIVLVIAMFTITWLLGRGGVRTAIEESKTKYRVVHWLQDVIAFPSVFKTGGGETLAIQRANQLTTEYLQARQQQFRVVIRQVAFAISLQVIASTALLALGGWLVIDGQLTLGQLVASELVVTIVVGAFAKAGKSLEKFYDLMAGVDKVGHLIDIPVDPRHRMGDFPDGPIDVSWGDLRFGNGRGETFVPGGSIRAGANVAIRGNDLAAKNALTQALAGLRRPISGIVQVSDIDSLDAATTYGGKLVGYAGALEVFQSTLRENVDLGRPGIGSARVREVLAQVGLTSTVLRLSDGLLTRLQTGGYPLATHEVAQLAVARAIASSPKLLIIDSLLDRIPDHARDRILKTITDKDAPWTLIIITDRDDVADLCEVRLTFRANAAPERGGSG
ncbi:MAG: ABC transporter ATP-binding protein [Rubripirellula sp.]|nr:ABC transporter ATP-binding protein [Rubripirellula sp.]